MKFWKLTLQRVYLNLKSLGTFPMTVFLGFIVPTLFCFSLTVIVSFEYGFGMVIGATTMLIGFITYGTVAGTFRRSTLNKNTNMTSAVRWVDNLATLLTMILLGLIMVTYALIVIFVFDWLGFLMVTPGVYTSKNTIDLFTMIGYVSLYYNVLLITVITYSMSYLFQGFFDSDIMFFSLALIMLILYILFGGTLNNYFTYDRISGQLNYGKTAAFGTEFFVPSLFFPFYAPSEFLHLQGDAVWNNYGVIDAFDTNVIWTFMNGTDGWRYNIMWFVPYAHIFGWWTLGFVYKIFRPTGT